LTCLSIQIFEGFGLQNSIKKTQWLEYRKQIYRFTCHIKKKSHSTTVFNQRFPNFGP
jgi:hypothetical protein